MPCRHKEYPTLMCALTHMSYSQCCTNRCWKLFSTSSHLLSRRLKKRSADSVNFTSRRSIVTIRRVKKPIRGLCISRQERMKRRYCSIRHPHSTARSMFATYSWQPLPKERHRTCSLTLQWRSSTLQALRIAQIIKLTVIVGIRRLPLRRMECANRLSWVRLVFVDRRTHTVTIPRQSALKCRMRRRRPTLIQVNSEAQFRTPPKKLWLSGLASMLSLNMRRRSKSRLTDERWRKRLTSERAKLWPVWLAARRAIVQMRRRMSVLSAIWNWANLIGLICQISAIEEGINSPMTCPCPRRKSPSPSKSMACQWVPSPRLWQTNAS